MTFHGHVGYFIALLLKTWFSGQQHWREAWWPCSIWAAPQTCRVRICGSLRAGSVNRMHRDVEKHCFREPGKVPMLQEGMETTPKAQSRKAPSPPLVLSALLWRSHLKSCRSAKHFPGKSQNICIKYMPTSLWLSLIRYQEKKNMIMSLRWCLMHQGVKGWLD